MLRSALLLVTDSPEAALGLQTLLEIASNAAVIVIQNEEDALARIETEGYEFVFCYYTSGTIDAVNFLSRVWERKCKTARFVIGRTIDGETRVRCALGAHEYLELPLESDRLHDAIARACDIKQFVQNEKMAVVLSRMRSLPSKPTIYLEVMREMRSPLACPASIAQLVSKDLGISTKLLQVANSSVYRRSEAVNNVEQAVLFLGLETTGAMVLSLEAIARFDKVKPLYFTSDKIGTHSQTVAEVSKRIAEILGQSEENRGYAFLGALLHDLGKLALAVNFEEEYKMAANMATKQNRPIHQVENKILGVTHADVGGYLLSVWGLPLPVIEAVAFHHEPFGVFGDKNSPAAAVHLAEQIVGSTVPMEEIVAQYQPDLGLRDKIEGLNTVLPGRKVEAQASKESGTVSGGGREHAFASTGEPALHNSTHPNRLSKLVGGVAKIFH